MSRSYKKYPYIGCSDSEKFDKRYVNKRLRSKVKVILNTTNDTENLIDSDLPTRDDIKDTYDFAKDGGYDLNPKEDKDLARFNKKGKLVK